MRYECMSGEKIIKEKKTKEKNEKFIFIKKEKREY